VPGSDLQGLVLRHDEERDEDLVLDEGVRGAEQDAEDARATGGLGIALRMRGRGKDNHGRFPFPVNSHGDYKATTCNTRT